MWAAHTFKKDLWKQDNSFPISLAQFQVTWVAQPLPAAQGARREPTPERSPSVSGRTPVDHTRSDPDNVDTLVHLVGAPWGCGRKQVDAEKTHADMGRTCKLPRGVDLFGWESIFFLLIIIMKRDGMKQCCWRSYWPSLEARKGKEINSSLASPQKPHLMRPGF